MYGREEWCTQVVYLVVYRVRTTLPPYTTLGTHHPREVKNIDIPGPAGQE